MKHQRSDMIIVKTTDMVRANDVLEMIEKEVNRINAQMKESEIELKDLDYLEGAHDVLVALHSSILDSVSEVRASELDASTDGKRGFNS